MDRKIQTIATYNQSALGLAKKFDEQGVRIEDIVETFKLIAKENPVVLEIGCGNGRDALEILKCTNNYLGIDVSEELLKLAQQKVPNGRFEVADIEFFTIPKNIDIVFAFASLIHVPKDSLSKILGDLSEALNDGGVVRLSMKFAKNYQENTKEDEYGIRTYYLYSLEDVEEIRGDLEVVKMWGHELRGQKWLEIILRKE